MAILMDIKPTVFIATCGLILSYRNNSLEDVKEWNPHTVRLLP